MPGSTAIAHLDIVVTSPVLAATLRTEAEHRPDITLGLTIFSWIDFVRSWEFSRSHIIVDGFLDDHVPLALKLRALRKIGAHPLVLSPPISGGVRTRAALEGASGWVTPDMTSREIIDAVRRPVWAMDETPIPGVRLTDREAQVLSLYASRRAFTPRRLGRVMGVSEETVRSHLRRGRAKYTAAGIAVDTRERLSRALVQDGYLIAEEDWRAQGRW